MRPAHANSPEQLAELSLGGLFDLEDIFFDAERACVVVPFRDDDEAVVVEAPWTLSHALRWGLRSRKRYAALRRWLVTIFGAVGPAEVHGRDENLAGPHDVLEVYFDAEDSEVCILTDGSWITVCVPVQRIDVVVEETPEHVGWGMVHPHQDGVVHAAPPPGSRAMATRFRLFLCRACGAWNLGPEEIVHLSTRCEGRSDLSRIDAVTTQAVKRETL